jgi:hypothetical protein
LSPKDLRRPGSLSAGRPPRPSWATRAVVINC